MTPFLEELLGVVAIDIEYLNSYLTLSERQYLDDNLKSIEDLKSDLYTNQEGRNLEALLHFLCHHREDITHIWSYPSEKEILIKLYTSNTISGNYDCFRFDLSKFDQTYNSIGQKLTLYRVGREGENKKSLGNSWSKSHNGLRSYAQASSIDGASRPVFEVEINDSEVLCEVNSQEDELILKKNFILIHLKVLDTNERQQIFT